MSTKPVTQPGAENKRQNQGTQVAERKIGAAFRSRLEVDMEALAASEYARRKAKAERQAKGARKAAPKSVGRLAPDMYHDRVDTVHRLLAIRCNQILDHKQDLFFEAYFNSLVRSRKRSKELVTYRYLVNCAKKYVRNANMAIVGKRAERACSEPQDYIPAGAYGALLDIRFEECVTLEGTPTIYPIDRSEDAMRSFNRRLARLRRKALDGNHLDRDTYEATSDASFYRRHAISCTTWYRWRRAGPEVLEARLRKRGLLTEWHRCMSVKKEGLTATQPVPPDAAPESAAVSSQHQDAKDATADMVRPIVAPGDDAPDDPALIPTRHDDPPGVPRTAPAAGAPASNCDARLATIRAKAKAAWERVRAEAIAAERAEAEFFGDGDDAENKLFAASMSRQLENVDEEKDYAR